MTTEQLAAISGVILSLLFSYTPGLSDKFDKLEPTYKRLIIAALLALVAGAVFGLACGNVIDTVTCDKPGAIGLVNALIAALVANQAAYLLSPTKSKQVQTQM
jgi:hypothetical protein